MFQPRILQPDPDPFFVRELRKIDPDLRVIWGQERYFLSKWVVERRMSPERYFSAYASLLESDKPRFVDQPIFDTNQPIYDEEGEFVSYTVIGYRRFDLAPEYEWLHTIETKDGKYKPLGMDDLLALRREYAWNRNHPYSRAKFEEEQRLADEAKERDQQRARVDAGMEGVQEAWSLYGKRVTVGQPRQIFQESPA